VFDDAVKDVYAIATYVTVSFGAGPSTRFDRNLPLSQVQIVNFTLGADWPHR